METAFKTPFCQPLGETESNPFSSVRFSHGSLKYDIVQEPVDAACRHQEVTYCQPLAPAGAPCFLMEAGLQPAYSRLPSG